MATQEDLLRILEEKQKVKSRMPATLAESLATYYDADQRALREQYAALEREETTVRERLANGAAEAPTITLGEQLKAARRAAGHSQQNAAAEIRVETTTLARIEQGRTNPRNETLLSIQAYIEKYEKPSKSPVKA